MDEAPLVQGLRERREDVVATFMERYRSLLFHCIAHFESEPSARDDLYQELVLYVFERLDAESFDPAKGSFGTWLYRVGWCRCVDLKRKREGRANPRLATGQQEVPDRPDPRPGPGELAGEAEVGDLVRRAMARLEVEDQDLLELRFVRDRTLVDISGTLGLSHEQCKYRLKRASTALRRVILNELSLDKLAAEAGLLQKTSKS